MLGSLCGMKARFEFPGSSPALLLFSPSLYVERGDRNHSNVWYGGVGDYPPTTPQNRISSRWVWDRGSLKRQTPHLGPERAGKQVLGSTECWCLAQPRYSQLNFYR